MQIDLNQPFTTNDVAQLLAFKDDSQRRQLRVTQNGIAFLSGEIGNTNIYGLAFRLETWLSGNGYTGAEAASDPDWVKKVENVLRTIGQHLLRHLLTTFDRPRWNGLGVMQYY